ncbi:hypothetical protein NLX83_31890 [Allokutzneria sp. A3M-2-11 16]|uniref:hypothetical protein n=1 Tax=Allokutzneria sp. A3M-2-11 16 TaxID=2962043 RepID=UPI0020B88BB5|nr:hypothetical protein [Allokutzneria sp. A3M-2-11 16]MCP3803881.1 hypothetical protein [Allokutzneria sp. A3M-2-11 16]
MNSTDAGSGYRAALPLLRGALLLTLVCLLALVPHATALFTAAVGTVVVVAVLRLGVAVLGQGQWWKTHGAVVTLAVVNATLVWASEDQLTQSALVAGLVLLGVGIGQYPGRWYILVLGAVLVLTSSGVHAWRFVAQQQLEADRNRLDWAYERAKGLSVSPEHAVHVLLAAIKEDAGAMVCRSAPPEIITPHARHVLADRAGIGRDGLADDEQDRGTTRCMEAIRVLHERANLPKTPMPITADWTWPTWPRLSVQESGPNAVMPLCEAMIGDIFSRVRHPFGIVIGEVHARRTSYGVGWSIVDFRDCTPM